VRDVIFQILPPISPWYSKNRTYSYLEEVTLSRPGIGPLKGVGELVLFARVRKERG
jgi:hypothetical protein